MIRWETSPEFMKAEELARAYRQAIKDEKAPWAAELKREAERRGLQL